MPLLRLNRTVLLATLSGVVRAKLSVWLHACLRACLCGWLCAEFHVESYADLHVPIERFAVAREHSALWAIAVGSRGALWHSGGRFIAHHVLKGVVARGLPFTKHSPFPRLVTAGAAVAQAGFWPLLFSRPSRSAT